MYHPLPELGFPPGGSASGAVFAIYYDNVRDRAFERAANTFLRRARQWFPNATQLKYGATSVAQFLRAWDQLAAEVNGAASTVLCGALFTHASKGGPSPGGGEGGIEMAGVDPISRTCPTDITVENAQIGRMTQLPWAPKAFLLLCGCNTGIGVAGHAPVAQSFALRQGVTTIGQMGYAYFSLCWPYYHWSLPDIENLCLWAFDRGRNSFPLLVTHLRIEGRVFR